MGFVPKHLFPRFARGADTNYTPLRWLTLGMGRDSVLQDKSSKPASLGEQTLGRSRDSVLKDKSSKPAALGEQTLTILHFAG
jgi:hypothetical protein